MPDSLPTPAEQPNILPSEKPAWLNAKTLLPIILVLGAGIALVLWQTSKSEKAREESNRLLSSKADAETWAKLIRDYPGQPATAIALLESAAEATEKKDPRKAAGLYDQFCRDYPKHPLRSAARFAQANSLAAAGDRGVAQTLYLSIITERPANPFRAGAAVGLANVQIAENRPEAARQVLNDILAENTGSAFLPDARALLEKLPPPPISTSAAPLSVAPSAPAPAAAPAKAPSQPAK
ncbi:MAG: hypothetical protein EBT57_08975 [Verrucomicrobia bacterium]|nr:hypothetical protein [Verrucomicrobiota bacterium]